MGTLGGLFDDLFDLLHQYKAINKINGIRLQIFDDTSGYILDQNSKIILEFFSFTGAIKQMQELLEPEPKEYIIIYEYPGGRKVITSWETMTKKQVEEQLQDNKKRFPDYTSGYRIMKITGVE